MKYLYKNIITNKDDWDMSRDEDMVFVGREKDLQKLLVNLKKPKSIILLSGEVGIGKSSLLDVFNNKVGGEYFIGYYDRKNALVSEPHLVTYPINIVLSSLITNIQRSETVNENLADSTKKVLGFLVEFARKEQKNIAVSIIEDIIRKSGLDRTVDLAKEFVVTQSKSGLNRGMEFLVNQNKEDILDVLRNIFTLISNQFPDKDFVLIFDQMESLGNSTIDFLINFVNFLPNRYHIIISFKTEDRRWGDPLARKLYQNTYDKLIFDLKADELKLDGLTAEEIGDWIEQERNTTLPLVPNLHMIRQNSAGLPILLSDWIKKSETLDYREINREILCQQIIRLADDLGGENRNNLEKLSILLNSLDELQLVKYLELQDIGEWNILVYELIKRGIFDPNSRWFRHEIIHKCFQDSVSKVTKKIYHEEASIFFHLISNSGIEKFGVIPNIESGYRISLCYAYHLHHADKVNESYDQNKRIAVMAVKVGDLLTAEKCYLRAIEDADKMHDMDKKNSCIHDLTATVYLIWGLYKEAYTNFEVLLSYYKQKDDPNIAKIIYNLGFICFQTNRYKDALNYYLESLSLFRKQIGNYYEISETLNNIGTVYERIGKFEDALSVYEESYSIKDRIGDIHNMANVLNNIGTIFSNRNQLDDALDRDYLALDISEVYQDKRLIAMSLNNIGEVFLRKGELDKSVQYFEKSLEIKQRLGQRGEIAGTLINIGLLCFYKEEYQKALDTFETSKNIYTILNSPEGIAKVLHDKAMVYEKMKEYHKALELYNQALTISTNINNKYGMSLILKGIGIVYLRLRKFDNALKFFKDSLSIKVELKDQNGTAELMKDIELVEKEKANENQ